MAETKTATLKVTLSLVNTIFRKKGKDKPFQVEDIAVLKKLENSSHVGSDKIAPAFARTKLYGILQKRIDEEAMSRTRLEVVGKALYDCKFKDPRAVQALAVEKLLPYVNAKLANGTDPIDIGEIVLVHMATDPKTSAAYKETKLAPTIKLSEQYDDAASREDPIGVSVRVFQGVVATMWQETGVSPFELATAIDGSSQLHPSHDKLLAQLVATNFTAAAVKSALKGARTTEAWTATGVDGLIEAALFVCNYPLRAIIKHFRRAGALETFTTSDPSILRAQAREFDTLSKAFEPYREHYSYFSGLEALAQNNAGLRKKISDLLKEAHILSADEIHEKVMTEYRGLDPNGEAGDVFATEEEASSSLLRVDSAADATIVKPGVIRKDDLSNDRKTWSGAGRTSFSTTYSGKVKGSVKWNKKHTAEARTGEMSFQVHGHVSEQCKQNLLSLESLFESDEWKFATFQLDKEGKSYLYGSDGKRVLLERITGKKGWWIRVHHGDCKSEICSRIYGLIRVQGKPVWRTGPLDERTRSTNYIVQNTNKISICKHTPHDRSQLLHPHEIDIYDNLPDICHKCHPSQILGTLTLRTSRNTPRTQAASTTCNLYATGIQKCLTEEDVYEMFDDFGSIVEIEFPAVFDGKPRMDSAQVTFRKPHEARRAHRRMKGFQMWGKDVITSLERFPEKAPTKDVKLVEEVESVPAEVVTSEMLEEDSGIQQDIKDERVSLVVSKEEVAVKDVMATEEVESVPSKAVTMEDTVTLAAEGGPIDKVDNNAKSVEDDDNLPSEEEVPCADSEEGPKDDGDENIERTVTAKAIHLRLGRSYYDRAKKSYQGKDKITLTDVGEVFQLHEIYNHRSLYVLRQMFRIELPAKYSGFSCDACDAGKMARMNSRRVYSRGGTTGRDLKPGEEWHMDLMFFPQEYGHRKGNIVSTRVDGESRASDTAVIRSKDKTIMTLKLFISRSATGKPSRIRVDRGWEYLNAEFKNVLHRTGD